MPYKGSIKHSVAFTVDITPATNNSSATAVTFASIVRRDRLREVDTLTIPTGQAQASRTDTLGAAVVRLDIAVYPPENGIAQVRVTQGPNVITHDCVGDTTLAFDVVI